MLLGVFLRAIRRAWSCGTVDGLYRSSLLPSTSQKSKRQCAEVKRALFSSPLLSIANFDPLASHTKSHAELKSNLLAGLV